MTSRMKLGVAIAPPATAMLIMALFELLLVLDARAPNLSLGNFAAVFFGILVPLVLFVALVPARVAIARSYRELDTLDSSVGPDHLGNKGERRQRIIVGRVVPLCSPGEMLFSPFTSRSGVLRVTEVSMSRWPIGDGGRARVCKSVPFEIETGSGAVRIESVQSVIVPRMDGFSRRVDESGSERVQEFYEGIGGDQLRSYEATRDSARKKNTYAQTYELVISAHSHVRIYAVFCDASEGEPQKPSDLGPSEFVHIDCAKVSVVDAIENSARLERALEDALKRRRGDLLTASGLLVASLIYVPLVLFGHLD